MKLWSLWSPAMTLLEGRSDEIGDGPALGTMDTALWSDQSQLTLPCLALPPAGLSSADKATIPPRTPGFPDSFASSTMGISAAAASNCSRRVVIAASNVQATKKPLCRRCRICGRSPPWSFCSPQLFFQLSRTAVALDWRSPEHTIDPRKMASTCRYCHPFPGQPHLHSPP